MCGRFCCSLNPTKLETKLKDIGLDVNNQWINVEKYNPRYNCSPRSYIPVVRKSDKDNTTLQSMVNTINNKKREEKKERINNIKLHLYLNVF